MRYVLVFANDYMGIGTRTRCDRAVRHVKSVASYDTAVIVLSAGRDAYMDGQPTLAVQMREYIRRQLPHASFLCNETDDHVWGSLQEIAYAYELIARRDTTPRIDFVTNSRHMRRIIRIILVWFPNISACRVYSTEKPPPWWHECMAYGKLFIERTIPVAGSQIAAVRRLYKGGW